MRETKGKQIMYTGRKAKEGEEDTLVEIKTFFFFLILERRNVKQTAQR